MNQNNDPLAASVAEWLDDSALHPDAKAHILEVIAPFLVADDSAFSHRYVAEFRRKQPDRLKGPFLPSEYEAWLTEQEPDQRVLEEVQPIIADICTAIRERAQAPEQNPARLSDCERRLQEVTRTVTKGKGWLATGAVGRLLNSVATSTINKTPGWITLIKGWSEVDRKYALGLFDRLPWNLRAPYLERFNHRMTLDASEWEALVAAIGKGEAAELIRKMPGQPILCLPPTLIEEIGRQLGASLKSADLSDIEGDWAKVTTFAASLKSAKTTASPCLPFLGELLNGIRRNPKLALAPVIYLDYILKVVQLANSLGWLDESSTDYLVSHERDAYPGMVQAACFAGMATAENAAEFHRKLLMSDRDLPEAEELFLLDLIRGGLGATALALAEASSPNDSTASGVRRVWLCLDNAAARAVITPDQVAGSPAGELLAQPNTEKRVAYLKKITADGDGSVPAEVWCGPVPFPGVFAMLRFKPDQAFAETNPLFVSRQQASRDPKTEYLRLFGLGHYRFAAVDRALVEAMIAWRAESPTQVDRVASSMLAAIVPERVMRDELLRSGAVRQFIITRGASILGAAPDVLRQFVDWLRATLVDRKIQWREGDVEFTVQLPPTALGDAVILAASVVAPYSRELSEQLILWALDKLSVSGSSCQTAGRLWSSYQPATAMKPPVQLSDWALGQWQIGMIDQQMPEKALAALSV